MNTTMNREETIKVIQDYTEFFNKAKEQGRTVTVFDYVDRNEMNKEKAIEVLETALKSYSWLTKQIQALQFAIDYMKDEGEILGWVNYYPEMTGDKLGTALNNIEKLKEMAHSTHKCIQIPIRKPK